MKKVALAAAVALVLVVCGMTRASNPIGVYALIDKVVLEPSETAAERVQIWGAFSLAQKERDYGPPIRGYFYYTLAKGQEKQCRAEWNDLKKLAGSGQIVGFGARFGALGSLRKARLQAQPTAPADAKQLAQLIADLDSEEFSVRDKATRELEKLGPAAETALRKLLDGKPSAEVRRRVERLLKEEAPDLYPLNFGMSILPRKTDYDWHPAAGLLQLPTPVTPGEGELAVPGKVTLVARVISHDRGKTAKYSFEVEYGSGRKEQSEPIDPKGGEVKWSPKLEVKPGESYTWRVKAVHDNWAGPMAAATFQGKRVQ